MIAPALIVLLFALSAAPGYAQSTPLADYHQHLFSPAAAKLVSPAPPAEPLGPITARDVIARLDEAGIQKAVVLSAAYTWGDPSRTVENEYEQVKAENDWTGRQVAQYPDRLIAFCSVNPLRDYALEEIARCAKDDHLRRGLTLHLGNSAADYHNAQHLNQLRRVFRAANEHRMPIVVHMRPSISRQLAYGRNEARIFLNNVIAAAPDVPIQIAHMGGAGGYRDDLVDGAMSVFVDAIRNGDRRMQYVYFDVATAAHADNTTEDTQRLVARIREVGADRILYGSDAAMGGNLSPREGWDAFTRLPLTQNEFDIIAGNAPSYMR
jgi:predicted TIM-barrel fold metal-dependent hydrolase